MVAAVQPDTLATVALVETSLRRMVTSEKMGLLAREGVAVVVQAEIEALCQTTTTPAVAAAASDCLDRAVTAPLVQRLVGVVVAGQVERTDKVRQMTS